jgi:transcriptional regulator with XRE-family HTH domain
MNKDKNKQRNIAFGQFARRLRKKNDLNQTQIAQALGVTHRAYVSKLESGIFAWQLWQMEDLANLFELKLSDLLKQFETQVD